VRNDEHRRLISLHETGGFVLKGQASFVLAEAGDVSAQVSSVWRGSARRSVSDMSNRSRFLAVVSALVLGMASNAAAQTPAMTSSPSYELSAGYQFLHLPDQSFPFGLAIDAAMHRGSLGLIAEGGWSLHSDDEDGFDITTNMWHIGAGARWTGFGPRKLWPYAQVIVGAAIAHVSAEFDGLDDSDTETSFMLQPGAGVTFVAGDGWGIFGQVDYRRTFFEEADDDDNFNNQFRVFVGARMILD
jgi:hypothetical protein